ncbi:efflux transporter periplasmic adaptor subunit [Bradyrhizobium icense]|uniref:Efflux transporter periplasmic adaptor subunit n=1 Tax=Bradyrhizobium icense TaxID=1274631 RepID=A0A1B1UR81_9BRAD|nr:efflux transporter periplasmic adaptor subunit [Bradyrhizobium icense]
MLATSGEGAAPPRRRRGFLVAAAAIAAIVVAVMAVAMVNRRASTATISVQQAPALTATSAIPRELTWDMAMEASGTIAAWQEANIGAQIGGYQLSDVLVNVGDQVKKGQVLTRLDPNLLRADEAQLKARYDQAEANWQRASSLKGRGFLSDKDALQQETEAKTAEALLAAKQLQLKYTEVVAPDDGVISSRTATLGAVVPVGQELFRLIRQNRLEWRGELTAAQLAQIVPGQRIILALPDGATAAAKVRQTAPSLDPQSRLGVVYADLEPGSRARAGMYVSGRVILGESQARVIPSESVVIRDGRSYVLKIADGNSRPRVALQAVTIGRRQGSDVEITSGIEVDDRVVVQGAGFLKDGDIVRLAAMSDSSSVFTAQDSDSNQ